MAEIVCISEIDEAPRPHGSPRQVLFMLVQRTDGGCNVNMTVIKHIT
ncbi:hypothetical protein [Paenibacillus sp. JCM 10914]